MFIVSPRIGLCNQLQTIVKSILLGIKYNRNIYINKFQTHLYNKNLCDINQILDIKKINDYIKTLNTKIMILPKIDNNIINNIQKYYLPKINYNTISRETNINNYIEKNLNKNILYLGNIVSLDIYTSFGYHWNDYNNLYYNLMSNIVFHDKFYKIKDYIKNTLSLTNYRTIHLRIEDDAIKHFSNCFKMSVNEYNDKLLDFYNKAIIKNPQPSYICSGILDYDNKLNYKYYTDLMKNNIFLFDKKNIHIDDYYLKNRELIAIVDLLIAYDSDHFIGNGASSFTLAINAYFRCKKNIDCEIFYANNI